MADLTTDEISSRVYNTRPSKEHPFKPLRSNNPQEEKDSSVRHSLAIEATDKDRKHSSIACPEVGESSPEPLKKVTKTLKPVDEARKLLTKIDNRLNVRIERAEQAKALTTLLIKLRKLFTVDNDIPAIVLRGDTMAILLSTSEFICRFEFLTEETLQCITPLTRSPELRNAAMDMALNHGCLILCLSALRYFKHNGSIRTLAVELLARSIEIVQEASTARLATSTKKHLSDSYVTHQLLLHGAATTFPAILCLFVQADVEIGTKRLLKYMATNIAMSGRWSAVRDCIWILRKMSAELQAEAATILTGMVASSPLVAEKVLDLRGWDDLSGRLTDPTLDFTDMPPQWLEGSLRSMQMMQSKYSISGGAVDIPPTLEDMVYNMHFADEHSTQRDLLGEENKLLPLKFESLPNSYYKRVKVKKSANKTVAGGTIQLSKSHARLLHSPFGDPRKVLEKELQKKKKMTGMNGSAKCGRRAADENVEAILHSDPEEKAKPREAEIEYPKVAQKHAIIAERLFGAGADSESALISAGENRGSALDKLSYEEKLLVMLMQVKDEMNIV